VGCDASPVLEAAEHALDEFALAIGGVVKGTMSFAAGLFGDDRSRDRLGITQCIAVVGGVAG
jgi:hypothetical protein